MIQISEGSSGFVRSIFWRKVTPGDFFNIERTAEAGPAGGGGQLYLDIPLGGSVSLQEFGNFVNDRPLDHDDSTWPRFERQAYSVSSPVVVAPLVLTPRRGKNRRYRIANQNRQAGGGHRHPAWSSGRGFPKAPDDVASLTDPRMPDLSYLKVFIARTDRGEFHVGYINSAIFPIDWPSDVGLEVLFKPNSQVRADGIVHIPPEFQLTPEHLATGKESLGGPESTEEVSYSQATIVRRSTVSHRRRGNEAGIGRESGGRHSAPSETVTIQAPRALEAEDWVETRLLETNDSYRVRRIGHTSLERIPLEDGFLPGADLIINTEDGQHPERFIEVKSAEGTLPTSIRLTASELERAKQCGNDKLPYDIWIVLFGETSVTATIISNFEKNATNLTIEDFVSFELQISTQKT